MQQNHISNLNSYKWQRTEVLLKNDFGPAKAVGRSQTRPVEFFSRASAQYIF